MELPPPQQRPASTGPSSVQRRSAAASGSAFPWHSAADGQLQLLCALQEKAESSTTRLAKVESVVGLWQRTFEDLVKAAAIYCDGAAGPSGAVPRPSRSSSTASTINKAGVTCTDSLRLLRQPSDELLNAQRATTPELDGSATSTAEAVAPELLWHPHVIEKLRRESSPKMGDFRELCVDVVGTPTFSLEHHSSRHTELAEALSLATEDIAQEVEERLRSKLQAELLDLWTLHKSDWVPTLQESGQLEAAGRHVVKRMDDISQLIVEVKQEQHAQSMELISLKARLDVLAFDQLPNTKHVPCSKETGVHPASACFRAEALKAAAALEKRNQAATVASAKSRRASPQVGSLWETNDAKTCNISSVESNNVLAHREQLEGCCAAVPSSASGATPNGDATKFEARLEALEAAQQAVSTGGMVTHGEVLELKTRLESLEKAQQAAALSAHAAISTSDGGDMAHNADFDKLRMALARTVRHVASLGDDLGVIRAEHAEFSRRVDILGEATAGAAAHSIQRLENALSEELVAKRMQLERAMNIQGQYT